MAQLAEFVGNNLFMSFAFLIVLFIYLSMVMNEKMQRFTTINSSQLTQLVNNKGAVLIDVRSSESFEKGHIANAINMPLTDFSDGKASLKKFKNKTVITYCDRGHTSQTVCKQLINNEIEPVFNLGGGLNSWKTEKLPLVKK